MTLRIPANEVIQMLMTDDLSCSELNGAADQARRLAQWDKAIRLCDQSLALCTEATLESEYCRAVTQVYLGAIYHSMGADDEADQYYRDSYDLFHIIEYEYSRWNEAVTCYGLGLIAQSRSDFNTARAFYRQSHQSFKKALEDEKPPAKGKRTHQEPGNTVQEHKEIIKGHIRRVEKRIEQVNLLTGGETTAGLPGGIITVPVNVVLVGNILEIKGETYRIKKTFDAGSNLTFYTRLGSRYFVLRVYGKSMTEVGINGGDCVVVREQSSVETGEIAAILRDGLSGPESTIKRFYRQGDRVVLKAANPDFKPQEQFFQASDPTIRVLGKVMAVASPQRSK